MSLKDKLTLDKVKKLAEIAEEQRIANEKAAQALVEAALKAASEGVHKGKYEISRRFWLCDYAGTWSWSCLFNTGCGPYRRGLACKKCFKPELLIGLAAVLYQELTSESVGFHDVEIVINNDTVNYKEWTFHFQLSW